VGALDGDLRGIEVEMWSVNSECEVREEMESENKEDEADEESDACLARELGW